MQSVRWYLNRLGRMSGEEVVHRIVRSGRACAARFGIGETAPPRAAPTDRPGARFIEPAPGLPAAPYCERAERLLAGEHDIFDLERCRLGVPPRWNRDPLTGRVAPLVHAPFLDYRDERIVGNIKYLWEPNRHLHLVTLAQAFVLSGELRYAQAIALEVGSWIAQCPAGRGANWASALELGIRLVNWSLAWQLLGGSRGAVFDGGRGADLRHAWLDSIYRHARAVTRNFSRYSSANNHLIGEAAGVFVASVTWPYWPEMRRWGEQCRDLLEREVQRQNAPDGGNREQALAYQQFVLDFLLLAGLAARASRQDFSARYWRRLEAMLEFVASLTDCAGNVPMIGDADGGYVVRLSAEPGFCPFRSLVASGALLFERPDLARKAGRVDHKTCWLLGADAPRRLAALLERSPARFAPRTAFPDSGYYLLGDRFETQEEIRLLVDCGPLGFLSLAAHGHADALAVLLSVGGREVLIDPGTYTYHTEPQWRRYFRSTAAHNTVLVDECDQSEQGGNFLWSAHAAAHCLEFERSGPVQRFAGEHDGYRRLADPLLHRRSISYDPGAREFLIEDLLECRGAHEAARQWHFAESLEPQVASDGRCRVQAGSFTVLLEPLEALERASVVRAGTSAEGGWVSGSFGRRSPCTTLRWHSRIAGRTVLRTRLRCRTEP